MLSEVVVVEWPQMWFWADDIEGCNILHFWHLFCSSLWVIKCFNNFDRDENGPAWHSMHCSNPVWWFWRKSSNFWLEKGSHSEATDDELVLSSDVLLVFFVELWTTMVECNNNKSFSVGIKSMIFHEILVSNEKLNESITQKLIFLSPKFFISKILMVIIVKENFFFFLLRHHWVNRYFQKK